MSLNILIADDSATSRSYVQKNLELADIHPVKFFQVKNGKEAFELMKIQKIELLFLDINMPEMTGIELVEQLKKAGILEKTKIIIISSEGSQKKIDQLKSLGVFEFIRKPFTPELFSDLVGRLFGGSSQ